jgi:adenylosuccinate synthase
MKRNADNYKLYVSDLFRPKILKAKLANIAKYYGMEDLSIKGFLIDVEEVLELIELKTSKQITKMYEDLIFEGAQGVLLDKDFGFFPNVTWSNTTSQNALEFLRETVGENNVEIFYVTRTYQTRHGNGYMSNEDPIELKNNELETNKLDTYQGNFRTGSLDTDLLNYALSCDSHFSDSIICKKNLVITCMDQYEIDTKNLLSELNVKFDDVYVSTGDCYTNIHREFGG